MKKLFGQLKINWVKLIIFAIIAGIYTGVMAALPITKDTSFADISITFEWWVLFGIIIIVNSFSPVDSALKCFVFFLISQPLVYLVQVPFNPLGWGIFKYYPDWFVWTLFTLPMGFVGYYMKKNKWWSLLILAPMLVFVGVHYYNFFRETFSFFPNHLLSTIFCAATMIIYPLFIFDNKKLKRAGVIISAVIIVAASAVALASGGNYYNTTLMTSGGSTEIVFDDSYKVYLDDESFGEVYIVYEENIKDYMMNAKFVKTGETKLTVEAPDGAKRVFRLVVNRTSYDIDEIKE